jgi:hypothetical protein
LGKTTPPYISRVPRPIEGNQPNRNKPKALLPLFYLFLPLFFFSLPPNSALTPICYSNLIPAVTKGVLANLADAKTHQGALALKGSLPGRSSLDSLRRPMMTGCLYWYNWPIDPEAGHARLQIAHEQVLRCVTRSRINTLFGDSAGDKEAFIGYYG